MNDTPLHRAAECGKSTCVKTLLAAGADPNRLNLDGMTPLDCARDCHSHVNATLKRDLAKFNMEAVDPKGRSPQDLDACKQILRAVDTTACHLVGKNVTIVGLASHADLNGTAGFVRSYDVDAKRLQVDCLHESCGRLRGCQASF